MHHEFTMSANISHMWTIESEAVLVDGMKHEHMNLFILCLSQSSFPTSNCTVVYCTYSAPGSRVEVHGNIPSQSLATTEIAVVS